MPDPVPKEPEKLMSTRELAARLRLSTDQVRVHVVKGELPAMRVGRGPYRFYWSEVLETMKGKRND